MCKLFTIFASVCFFFPVVLPGYDDNLEGIENEEIHFRVANGKAASVGQIPNQVSFKKEFRSGRCSSFCGGTIISRTKILTAGHCLTTQDRVFDKLCDKYEMKALENLYAVAGTLRSVGNAKDDNKTTEQWRRIKSAAVPQGYSFPKNDICVVFTTKPFVFNDYVKSWPLATRDMDYGNVYCLASGYGRISAYKSSDILQWAYLRLRNKRRCSHIHRKNMRDFICTSTDITNVLQGDSGGPLTCLHTKDPADKGKGVVVGIVSGASIRKGGWETFFTRVSSYKEFIEKNNNLRLNLDLYVSWLSVIIMVIS